MFSGIPPYLGSPGKGVAIVAGCTVGAFFVFFALAGLVGVGALIALGGIGVVQAAWIVPLWRYYRASGETETAKGLWIAAGIVFLLNAGCWGLVGRWR